MKQFIFRSLREDDIDQMYIAFQSAFSDYSLNFNMTKEEFIQKFVRKLGIDYSHSFGAFHEEELVGFIFKTIDNYQGRKSAFNGGTGVVPAFRGNHITAHLYEKAIPVFKANNVEQCVLEVLTDNERAQKVYQSIGFKTHRYFLCFKLLKKPNLSKPPLFKIEKISNPDWNLLQKFSDYSPSFLDIQSMLKRNIANEKVIVLSENDMPLAFAIYQNNGRLSQIAVDKSNRGRGAGSALIDYIYKDVNKKHLTVINVDKNASEMISFLEKLGFENQVDQYEMILTL
ncbi:GNAT family N-acetyltransferase [Fulvivirgaceae bacterium BMA10]|uniref:GNAT family N-acetyltransferase n=1 Tax=Splendidivirga corallicola TaxID=3051826 RepID=A0ABT8KLL9_9BACT|nr:GNAT family N-acetyltransferase [Fulvivirgaceae bacterium BMA10]